MSDPTSPLKITVEEKICLHLLEYINLRDEFIQPAEISQKGIAAATDVQRGHASVALISLKKKGLVDEKISRVKGSDRRKKVYFLTRTGVDETLKLKKTLRESAVVLRAQGGEQLVPIDEIGRFLDRKLPLVSIVSALSRSEGPLDIDSLNKTPVENKKNEAAGTTGSGDHVGSSDLRPVTDPTQPGILDEKARPDTGDRPPRPKGMGTMVPPPPRPLPPRPPASLLPPRAPASPPPPQTQITLSGRGRDVFLVLGVVLSFLCLVFLSLYLTHESGPELVVSLLCLFFSLLVLQLPLGLELASQEPGATTPARKDLVILIFSLAVLSVFGNSLLEEQFFAWELFRIGLVVIPLSIVLNLESVVPEDYRIEIAGIGGSLFLLYGIIQVGFPVFADRMHYPLLWILSGILIMLTVYSPGRPDEEGGALNDKGSRLLVSSCTGAGIFMLLALLAAHESLGHGPLGTALGILILLFGLTLCLLRYWEGVEQEIQGLLISSLFALTGFLFFFAAGIFFTLGKYIEGVAELLVGLVILKFTSNYLKLSKEYLFFISPFVVLGLLTVYGFYVGM